MSEVYITIALFEIQASLPSFTKVVDGVFPPNKEG